MASDTVVLELEKMRRTRHVCAAEALRSATRMANRVYGDHLAEAGVGSTQFSLLVRLYFTGPISMSSLAKRMETDRTTLTRNVAVIERDGLVTTAANGADKRNRIVELTDHGRATLFKAFPLWQRAQSRLREQLGDAVWASLMHDTRAVASIDPERATLSTPT